MNTQKLKVLLKALEEGSLTKAGNALGYTQSGITQMIRSLEDEVGFPLLIKNQRGVEPTNELIMLIPTMRQILRYEEQLNQEVDEIQGLFRGSLRIGSYISISMNWLPEIVAYFMENYPKVSINIEEGGQDELVKGILDGTLDLALISNPRSESVDFIPIADDAIVVAYSDAYDLGDYERVPVSVLKDYPLIMTPQTVDRDVRRVLNDAGISPNIQYTCKEDFAVLSMVRRGLGITVVPELLVKGFPQEFKYKRLKPEYQRTLGIALRNKNDAGPLARFFISYIKENL